MYSAGYDQYLRRLCSKLKYSRKETHEWCLEPEDLIDIWEAQAGKCAISGVNMTHHIDGGGHKEFNASIDRINSDQGYTPKRAASCLSRQHHAPHPIDGYVLVVGEKHT